ncbi:MAG: GNAT family N-acetyltransferase [Bacteroidales bacterium]
MENIVIRDYQPGDYTAILDLWLKTGLGGAHRGDNQQIIENSIKIGGKLLVAEDLQGRLAATSWMTFDGRRIHLHHFGVQPHLQRKGIGRKLAQASVDFAKEKGFQIKLEVHQSNKAAISLYTSLGFSYLGDYLVYIMRSFD